MNCPSDGTTLLMSERQGVEIDYCPACRGIWLDRGELDKILEQAKAASAPSHAAPSTPSESEPRYEQRRSAQPRYQDRRYQDPRSRKKKSPFEFLGDLFE